MNPAHHACWKLALLLITLGAIEAQAATLILNGAAAATTEGLSNVGNQGLIGDAATTAQMQIVTSTLSGQGLQVGDIITGLRTRLNGGSTMSVDRSISDLEITLGEAAFSIDNLSTTFASNMVNPVQVHDGAFTFFGAQMPGGSTPNAFGQLISFSTPYVYQGGDLVLMYTKPAATGGGSVAGDSGPFNSSLIRMVANISTFQATSGSSQPNVPVFQLEFSAAPEPSRAVLLLVGLLALAARRRVHRALPQN